MLGGREEGIFPMLTMRQLMDQLQALIDSGVSEDTPVLRQVNSMGYEDIYEPAVEMDVTTSDCMESSFTAVIL